MILIRPPPFSYLMAQNEQYLSDFTTLVNICQDRNVAVQTIKSIVHRPWEDHAHDPGNMVPAPGEPGRYRPGSALGVGHTGLFLNSAGDVHILPKVLDAANRFEVAPSDAKMQVQVNELGMRSLFP